MTHRLGFAILVGVVVAAASLEAGVPCHPAFIDGSTYPIGSSLVGFSAADIDADGYADLTTTTDYPQKIEVRRGLPGGTFGPPTATTFPNYSYESIVGQFTADTDPDVVLNSYTELYLMKGVGDGTFQAPLLLGPALGLLATGDLNSDGKLDLVGFGFSDGQLNVLLGNGDGTFQPPVQTPLDANVSSYAIGDVDEDGHPDIVATIFAQNDVTVFPGTGDGHFGAGLSTVAGIELGAIRLADINADDHLDVVLASGKYVGILLGNGDGTFESARDYPAGGRPSAVRVGDLDGDGVLDVVAFNPSYPNGYVLSSFRVLLGDGDGSLSPGDDYLISLLFGGVELADFGDDGVLDVAAAAVYEEVMGVYRGYGNGRFEDVPFTAIADYPAGPAAGDFDEDGRTDVVVGTQTGIATYLASGHGYFTPGPVGEPPGPYSSTTADFNRDGHLDLASTLYYYGADVRLGNGDGSFQPPVSLPITDGRSEYIVVGDFDADGKPDFAFSRQDSYSGNGVAIVVYFGRGDGTFDGPVETPASAMFSGMFAADLNDDGRTDIAVIDRLQDDLVVYLSLPGRTFAGPVTYDTAPGPLAIAAGDFRNLQREDVVVSIYGAELQMFENQGNGTLVLAASTPLAFRAGQLVAADFDGDGNLDLLAMAGDALFLRGLGDGTFEAPLAYPVGAPEAAFAGDADGNGKLDAIFTNSEGSTGALTTLMNGALGVRVLERVGDRGRGCGADGAVGGLRATDVPVAQGRRAARPTAARSPARRRQSDDRPGHLRRRRLLRRPRHRFLRTRSPPTPPPSRSSSPTSRYSSPFHDDIIAIATAGITGGCGGGDYCPTLPVRRDQMAAFLLKAEHGSAYMPPACAGIFSDVPCPSPFADWIEQLSSEGVTSGCGTGIYCPAQSVTRAQMAVFLLKTSEGSGYTPPPATGIFGDVPVGSFAADFIEDLYTRGITGGCSASPLLYCPGNTVLRQQMATFLVRTFFP